MLKAVVTGFFILAALTACAKADPSTAIQRSEASFLYENTEIGFSVELPSSWEGLFEVEIYGNEGINYRDIVSAYILHKPTLDEKSWYYARLVEFGRIRGDFTPERPPIMSEACRVLAHYGGYTFFMYTPNFWDEQIVAWHEAAMTEASASYLEFARHLDTIADTFRVLESTLPPLAERGSPDDKIFTAEEFGISFTIPADWEGKYIIEATPALDGSWGFLSLYHKASREWNEQAGWLCSILIIPGEDEYDDDRPPVMAGLCWILDKKGGYTYAAQMPSDVQYDANAPSGEEYVRLASQLNIVFGSFRVLD